MRQAAITTTLLLTATALCHATPNEHSSALSFTSASDFSLKAEKSWNGQLLYSTDLTSWAEWDGSSINSVNGKLYLRGKGNSHLCKATKTYRWTEIHPWRIESEDGVACNGNIENLLDYEVVAAGQHPQMDEECYVGMFNGCANLTEAPVLPATTLSAGCYRGMFSGCTSLTEAPALPATTLSASCYSDMFSGCTSLTEAPALPAATLSKRCYYGMFSLSLIHISEPTRPY